MDLLLVPKREQTKADIALNDRLMDMAMDVAKRIEERRLSGT